MNGGNHHPTTPAYRVSAEQITPELLRTEVWFDKARMVLGVGERGYDEDQVDDLLDRTADKLEKVMRENNALREALHTLGVNPDRYAEFGYEK